jgi:hypothetical protein
LFDQQQPSGSYIILLRFANPPGPVDRSWAVKPALQNAAASTASRPASVTIAMRPSVGWDGEDSRCDLGQAETKISLEVDSQGNQQFEPFQQSHHLARNNS